MKYLQRLSGLFVICCIVFSCQKEYSVEHPAGASNVNAQWQFKENGVQFKGPVDTVAVDTISGYKFLTINGHSTDGKSQITLQVFGADLKVGTYKTPYSLFAYLESGTTVYQTNQTAVDSFTITITKIDTTGVTGTFNGKVLSGSVSKTIVDGAFSAVFKTSTPVVPVSKDSGQVVLWSKAGCGGGTSTSPISVSVGSKSGQITQFFATEPSTCDPAGAYSIKLPVGTYPLVAKCGSDSITGSITVVKNTCTKAEINFSGSTLTGDYFPTTTHSNWTSIYDSVGSRAANAGDTTFTISTGQTVTAGGNTYNIFGYADFAYQYNDTFYYRKANNAYFQYYPASSNYFGFDTPTAVEYTFLQDNVAVGAGWSSPAYSGVITAPNGPISLKARVDGKILDIVSSATVGNITYKNVIKVRLSFVSIIGSVTTEEYREEQWFAKGVGLIRYVEYDTTPFTAISLNLNTTRYTVF